MNLKLLLLCAVVTVALVAGKGKGKGKTKQGGKKDVPPGQLKKVEKFLDKYGYIGEEGDQGRRLVEAIKKSQRYAGCKPNGNFMDECLADKVTAKRCGQQDMNKGKSLRSYGKGKGRDKRFVLGGPKWPKTALTYQIDDFSPDLDKATQESVIAKCIKSWTDVSALTFTKVTSGADIKISYQKGAHMGEPAGDAFDGPGGTLAHASYPTDDDLHFDEDETWAPTETCVDGKHINLFAVCVHEIGHNLGIGHSDTEKAIMYAYYGGCKVTPDILQDDISAVQKLYGPNPAATTAAPTGGTTEAPAGGSTEAPAGWSTEAPAGGSTEAPAGGSTEAPAGGSTEAPAGGSTESPGESGVIMCPDGSYEIQIDWFCDGMSDCDDNSDEEGCPEEEVNQLACKSGDQFIPEIKKCDKVEDCADGSDEADCYECEDDEHDCGNGYCVKYFWLCDGVDDCGNNNDEEGCSAA